jgi:hypothetical protein
VRAAFERATQHGMATLAQYMSGATEHERRRKAGVLMSGMSGTLSVARALADEDLRRRLLSAARKIYIEAFAKQ